ncbi:MAG: C39 family peptidase [Patescibacteria group bacterium]
MNDSRTQKKRTSWITLSVLCLAVAALLLVGAREALSDIYHDLRGTQSEEPLPKSVSYDDVKNSSVTNTVNENTNTSQAAANVTNTQATNTAPATIPAEFLLDVPFTSQAPKANWDQPYQDACEEASALTVDFYYKDKTFTPDVADQEILKFVEFEKTYLGFYESTTAAEIARVIRAYLGYTRVDVIENPTADQIKGFIAAGHPVIVPAQGQQLGNPNFTAPGPVYHMFVIRGYTKDQFITNDVGTRKGENYRYDISTVMNAMHDWNGGDVNNGAKRIIVIYPNS